MVMWDKEENSFIRRGDIKNYSENKDKYILTGVNSEMDILAIELENPYQYFKEDIDNIGNIVFKLMENEDIYVII